MTSPKLPEKRYALFCTDDDGDDYCYEDEYNKAINSFQARELAIKKEQRIDEL